MKTKRFDSAYPGSMFEKPEGGYVEFNDVHSLAGALVKNYDDMRRSVDDWTDTAIQNEKRAQIAEQQRDELLAALIAFDNSYVRDIPHDHRDYAIVMKARAAIAKAKGGTA